MVTTRSQASGQPSPGGAAPFALTEDEIRAFAGHARVQAHPKGTVIINEGDHSDSIYIVASGRVKVFLHGEDGKEVVLNSFGPGEYFGELVLDEGPRSASVATLEASKFYVITKADFRAFVSAQPDFAMRLITRLMHRVRVLTENVRSLALLDVYGRMARLLVELSVEEDGRRIIARKLTQKDIADRVGASREMVNRIFKDLIAGGYIVLEDKRIVIAKELPLRW